MKYIPLGTKAVLWDLDGVLIDSLSFDYDNCTNIASEVLGQKIFFSKETIKNSFALAHQDFWLSILRHVDIYPDNISLKSILEIYEDKRVSYKYKLHSKVTESLIFLKNNNIKSAVVSNNDVRTINRIIQNAKIDSYFDLIVGFDTKNPFDCRLPLRKKPNPDLYLAAIEILSIDNTQAVIIEDSSVGVNAALTAKIYVIGVTTGSNSKEELQSIIPQNLGVVVEQL